ncbi:MAG: carboxypeptidase [Ruminococcus sp.]|nr:carboxypeptidase [Ruminococcus sp.]
MSKSNNSGCKQAEVVQVIKTRTIVGTGTENDPVREVVQYWDLDGKLIAEK